MNTDSEIAARLPDHFENNRNQLHPFSLLVVETFFNLIRATFSQLWFDRSIQVQLTFQHQNLSQF